MFCTYILQLHICNSLISCLDCLASTNLFIFCLLMTSLFTNWCDWITQLARVKSSRKCAYICVSPLLSPYNFTPHVNVNNNNINHDNTLISYQSSLSIWGGTKGTIHVVMGALPPLKPPLVNWQLPVLTVSRLLDRECGFTSTVIYILHSNHWLNQLARCAACCCRVVGLNPNFAQCVQFLCSSCIIRVFWLPIVSGMCVCTLQGTECSLWSAILHRTDSLTDSDYDRSWLFAFIKTDSFSCFL